ncbi:similar to Saccharomyces cerevisiae YGL060W YBP2 Central kinetochore associated protein that mediates mitotic progression [Maudiozyma saulgeensis]|uniref:Similar to Saccharomyces cerevisiae YGL060W YBP2 Central kinetochore associated protein that mediates mitotic progression n=1 Tax=Maudiozyma saulgeensis TaxID=1789683 RepID=A0A1X7R0X5_9SACH|nr:similar to Saccharomyces cerevisiae YGL060W YBP2 Central kinetochore associated protein that mediates mitotic progression [Kazachstania saulgeensis]
MLNIKRICNELQEAFESDDSDPVAIMTLIEIFIDKVNVKSVPFVQKRLFLLTLLELLENHKDILAQIGWDLPFQLMKFLNKDNVDIRGSIRYDQIATAIILGFNAIALGGLPKETLDTGCELLASLNYDEEVAKFEEDESEQEKKVGEDDDEEDDEYQIDTDDEADEDSGRQSLNYDRVPGDYFIGFKVYILFEMIGATLKRISTLYPSKYLSLVVTATENMLLHTADQMQDPNLLMRRIHSFCAFYVPLEVPKDVLAKVGTKEEGALTQEQLDEIVKNEKDLQVKLLRRLSTVSVSNCLRRAGMLSEIKYFCKVSGVPYHTMTFYESLFDCQSRFYNFALSVDVDIKEEFINCLKEAKRVYQALPPDEEITSADARDAISEVVFKLSYSYALQKMVHGKKLSMAPEGIVSLSGIHYMEYGEHLLPEISLDDAVFLYLNFTTRSFFSPLYNNLNVESTSRYWLWVSLTHNSYSALKEQISRVQPYVIEVLLKTLLLKNCLESNAQLRMINFTLMTRILCLIKEELAFSFITKTLKKFPYPHGKSAALVMLSDLIMKARSKSEKVTTIDGKKRKEERNGTDELTDKMKSLDIDEIPFIQLNEERMQIINDLALDAIKVAIASDRKQTDINLVTNYSDFMKSVKSKWDKKLLVLFEKDLESALATLEKEK